MLFQESDSPFQCTYRGTNYSSRKRLERWPLRTPFHREWVWPESRGWLLWYEDEMKNADTANKGWCYLVLESRGAFQRAVGKPRRARLDWRRGSRRRASGHSRGAAPLTEAFPRDYIKGRILAAWALQTLDQVMKVPPLHRCEKWWDSRKKEWKYRGREKDSLLVQECSTWCSLAFV